MRSSRRTPQPELQLLLMSVCGEPMAVPQIVTLSYHEAGRWLDAQERVDQVPAPEED